MGIDERNRIETDLTNNGYLAWDPNEAYIHERILLTYRDVFYKHDRFPGNNTLVPIPRAKIPSFIESRDVLSPLALYDTYVERDMRGIVSVQFLAALKIFLGGDSEIICDINEKEQVDLIKSAFVPKDVQLTNEEITSADYTKTDNNEPVQPTLDPNILRIMQEIVFNANAFANEPDPQPLLQITLDENEPPKAPPIIKTEPTLQEILTEPEENDVVTELVKVKDEVLPEPEPIRLDFPEQTGIRSVDKRNYQEWLDTLEVI